MGTRNLTVIYIDGDYKVAQYGQWDGYPAGAGANIAEALQDIMAEGGLGRLADNVRGCVSLDDAELTRRYRDLGIDNDWMTMEEASRFKDRYPQLDRDMGSDIIRYIYEDGPQDVHLNLGFVTDTLFCEWAYVVDLDAGMLEVYTGYGVDRSSENRFSYLSSEGVVYKLDALSFDEVFNTPVDQLVERWEKLQQEIDEK